MFINTEFDAGERKLVKKEHFVVSVGGAAGGGARLTGSLGAISARLSVPRDDHERPHNVPGFYTTHTALYVHHERCNLCMLGAIIVMYVTPATERSRASPPRWTRPRWRRWGSGSRAHTSSEARKLNHIF